MDRILVVGGGVGGTLTANLVARRLSDAVALGLVDVTVIDADGLHRYQPGFVDVAMGDRREGDLARPERTLLDPQIGLLVDRAVRIDTNARTVVLASGATLPYDYLALATGSRIVPEAIEHFDAEAHHVYSAAAARRLREALDAFGGGRIVVGIASVPYKSPHAPLEVALLIDSELRERGLRDASHIDFFSPIELPVPSVALSETLAPILVERGIPVHSRFSLQSIRPDRKVIVSAGGEELAYDLLVVVPPHRGQQVLVDSGLAPTPDGWLPTDRRTLRVRGQRNIWALGDATDLPLSKAGSTAHFEAPVVAEGIVAALVGREPRGRHATYDGRGLALVDVGKGQGTMLRFDDDHPAAPADPNAVWHWSKRVFGRTYFHTVPRGRV